MMKISHPGWAVKYVNDTWLGGSGHGGGWMQYDYPMGAEVVSKEEDAKDAALDAVRDGISMAYEIVVAWEPMVDELQRKIVNLEKATKVTPKDISDIGWKLEEIKELLQIT